MTYTEINFILELGIYDTLLLDRDGVINKLRPGDYVKNWEEFEFIPEFLATIPQWTKRVKHIIVVTNQRGVGKKLFSEENLINIHNKMKEEIEKVGGKIEAIYYCTALDDKNPNRKPQPGMFHQILKDYPDINPNHCIMVGDQLSDMQFANNCGIAGIMVNH